MEHLCLQSHWSSDGSSISNMAPLRAFEISHMSGVLEVDAGLGPMFWMDWSFVYLWYLWCPGKMEQSRPLGMEIEIGKEAFKRGSEYVNKGMDKISFKHLRGYFNIDDTYILRKLSLILFPFNNAEWIVDGDSENSLSRPELYIPTMSLVSYILLRALHSGLDGKFSPEKLGMMFTRCVFVELFCISLMKICGYFIDAPVQTLDMVAYSGYKYVCVVLLRSFRMRHVRAIFGLYFYVSFFFFLSRSLKRRILLGGAVNRARKVYYLFGIVILQVLIIFILS